MFECWWGAGRWVVGAILWEVCVAFHFHLHFTEPVPSRGQTSCQRAGITIFGEWLLLFSSVTFPYINQSTKRQSVLRMDCWARANCIQFLTRSLFGFYLFYFLCNALLARAAQCVACQTQIHTNRQNTKANRNGFGQPQQISAIATAAAPLTISSLSEIIAPNVIDITGPISGDTNMAATIFGELFSTKPRAAKELQDATTHAHTDTDTDTCTHADISNGCAINGISVCTHSAVTISSK